jgi:hypothetical protein
MSVMLSSCDANLKYNGTYKLVFDSMYMLSGCRILDALVSKEALERCKT